MHLSSKWLIQDYRYVGGDSIDLLLIVCLSFASEQTIRLVRGELLLLLMVLLLVSALTCHLLVLLRWVEWLLALTLEGHVRVRGRGLGWCHSVGAAWLAVGGREGGTVMCLVRLSHRSGMRADANLLIRVEQVAVLGAQLGVISAGDYA